MDPVNFIEAMQKNAYGRSSKYNNFGGDNLLGCFGWDDTAEIKRLIWSGKLSKFQRPILYHLMRPIAAAVESAASHYELDLPEQVHIASLPTGTFNAVSMRPDPSGSHHIVFFEDEIFSFTAQISGALARAFPSTDPAPDGSAGYVIDVDEVVSNVQRNPDIGRQFAEVVTTYAETGRPSIDPFSMLRSVYTSPLGSVIGESVRYFVMGHEYAHVIKGHFSGAARAKGIIAGAEVDEVHYSWQQEVEADHLGLSLSTLALTRSNPKFPPAFGLLGPCVYLIGIDVMEQAITILRGGDEIPLERRTHPPARVRLQVLQRNIPRIMENYPLYLEEGVILQNVAMAAMEEMWASARAHLLSRRSAGAKSWASWR